LPGPDVSVPAEAAPAAISPNMARPVEAAKAVTVRINSWVVPRFHRLLHRGSGSNLRQKHLQTPERRGAQPPPRSPPPPRAPRRVSRRPPVQLRVHGVAS